MSLVRKLLFTNKNTSLLICRSVSSCFLRDFPNLQNDFPPKSKQGLIVKTVPVNLQQIRLKYDKKKPQSAKTPEDDETDEAEDDFDDLSIGENKGGSKVIKISVNSLRADLLLKSGLGTARK